MRIAARKLLFLLVIAAMVLAACAPVATAPGEGGAAAAEDITLTMWLGVGSEGAEQNDCLITNIFEPYNAKTPGVTVEGVQLANDWQAVRTALAGGGGPDIVITPGPSFVFEMAKAGYVLPLSDYAATQGWSDIFAPWALSLGLVDGELYSVPHELETLILYYNKTLFEEHGWTPPKTTDELMTLSQEIADAGIIPFSHANAEWRPSNEWFVGEFMNHVAGPDAVYQALIGEKSWTDPEFAESVDMLNTMQANGWFMGGLDRYYTATSNERHVAFGDGKAAMNIEGTWALNDMPNYFGEKAGNANDWDWVPMPSTDGTAIFDLGIGSTYSINAATKHPAEAADYLTYFFSPETQAVAMTACNYAPAPVEVSAESLKGIDPRNAAAIAALTAASAAGNYGYTTWPFWPPKSDVDIYEEIEKVWAGQMTTAEYLQGLQDLFQEELAAGDIPPIPKR